MKYYIGLIEQSDTGTFGISFPAFPGCISASDRLAEIYNAADEALKLHIKGMKEDNIPIPTSCTYEDIKYYQDNSNNSIITIISIEFW